MKLKHILGKRIFEFYYYALSPVIGSLGIWDGKHLETFIRAKYAATRITGNFSESFKEGNYMFKKVAKLGFKTKKEVPLRSKCIYFYSIPYTANSLQLFTSFCFHPDNSYVRHQTTTYSKAHDALLNKLAASK